MVSPTTNFDDLHSKASPSDIRIRCVARFETDGATTMGSGNHDEAIYPYPVLSRDPTTQARFLNRRKARALMALWEDALRDATKV